jgi:3-dehydroquinate synthase
MHPPIVHRLTLEHPQGRSELRIGDGALAALEELVPWVAGRMLFVLSTPRLDRLHGGALDPLRAAARQSVELSVEDGEGAKTLAHAGRLWQEMVVAGGKRDSRLVTFGGGTVSDLGGFVAGCFLRGISYAQVPTTLLAQVDAAIGGKTGIDLVAGKNTVGLFHHPDWVISDTRLLATLPLAERRSGLVEVVKMAVSLDLDLLLEVEAGLDRLLAAILAPVVAGAAAAKCAVVTADPSEGDHRRVLNFGHTLGHALEAALGFRHLRHGEAVAYGLLFALRLSRRCGLPATVAVRVRDLLRRLDLPPLPALDIGELLRLLQRDKKATEAGLVWVLLGDLGRPEFVALDLGQVTQELERFLADPFVDV